MTIRNLRAVAAALLLGAATVGGAAVLSTPVLALTVSAKAGAAIKEAQAMANAGNYSGANAKLREAEAAAERGTDDAAVIAQLKQYIAVKSGDTSTPAGAKAKFANDYN